jgi:hypothetical protein
MGAMGGLLEDYCQATAARADSEESRFYRLLFFDFMGFTLELCAVPH